MVYFMRRINRLKEAGLIDYFYKSSLLNATRCTMKRKDSAEVRPLSFWDFAGMFLLTIGGMFLYVSSGKQASSHLHREVCLSLRFLWDFSGMFSLTLRGISDFAGNFSLTAIGMFIFTFLPNTERYAYLMLTNPL